MRSSSLVARPSLYEAMNSIKNHWVSVRNHQRSFAEYTYVYPVISRRSQGLSIGVNLNPDKICNFDCVYCEVDRRSPGKAREVDPARLQAELAELVDFVLAGGLAGQARFDEVPALIRDIKDFAFSGDGEPTMIPNFYDCVQAVVRVKEERALTSAKIVLITNAAGLDKTDVRRGLALMDEHQGEIWGKLDAGTEDYYRRVNRSPIVFERLLANLLTTAQVRPIVIQSLFLRVKGELISDAELEAYCRRLNDLARGGGRIKEVHAYTIARPTPEPWATRLSEEELNRIAEVIRRATGLEVRCFS